MFSNVDIYEDISMDDSNSSKTPSTKSIQMSHGRNYCAICGGKATGINFDVLTCSSCKAFFRRNGVKPLEQLVCRLSGQCKIDERSRRQCTACRLRKCFAMGMIKERIRTEEQNQRHRKLVEDNRRQKMKKYRHQQGENGSKTVEKCRRQSTCSKSSAIFPNSQLDHIDLIFDLFIESSQDIIPEDFILKLDYDITNVLNLQCKPVSCLITFFKQLSHFQQLPVDDRLILLKYNAKIILPMLTYLLNTTFGVQLLVNHPGIYNVNNKIAYAYSLFAQLIPNDNKLLTLLIVVLLFCPCLSTNDLLYDAGCINETSRQLIQYAYDEYTQLLWYYILEKSLDDERQAVLTYTKLMTTCVRLQSVTSEIYDIVECTVQIDQLHMMMQSILHLT